MKKNSSSILLILHLSLKSIWIGILVTVWIFGGTAALQAEENMDISLQDASLLLHSKHFFNEANIDVMKKWGQRLQRLLVRQENLHPGFARTDEGRDLLKLQTKMGHFLALHQSLSQCLSTKRQNYAHHLPHRLLVAAADTDYDHLECQEKILDYSSLEDYIKSIESMNESVPLRQFQGRIIDEALKRAMQTYVRTKAMIKDEEKTPANLVEDICHERRRTFVLMGPRKGKEKNLCTEAMRKEIQEVLSGVPPQPSLADGPLSIEEAGQRLNEKVDKINAALEVMEEKIKVGKSGLPVGPLQLNRPKFDNLSHFAYRIYANEYLHAVSSDVGFLLLSLPVQNKVGALRLQQENLKKERQFFRGKSKFLYPRHGKVSLSTVKSGVEDIRHKLRSEILSLAKGKIENKKGKLDRTRKLKDETIELIKLNPLVAGEVLLGHPEFASLVCQLLKSLSTHEIKKEKVRKNVMIGTTVVSTILALAALYAATGPMILPAAVAAGIPLHALGLTSTLLGLAVKAGHFIHNSKEAHEDWKEKVDLKRAFLAGNGDSDGLEEAVWAAKKLRRDILEGLATLGIAAVDVVGVLPGLHVLELGSVGMAGIMDMSLNTFALAMLRERIFFLMKDDLQKETLIGLRKQLGGKATVKILSLLFQLPDEIQEKVWNELTLWNKKEETLFSVLNAAVKRIREEYPSWEEEVQSLGDLILKLERQAAISA